MSNRLRFALFNGPVTGDGAARSDAHLTIHTPSLRIPSVLRMIKNRDVSLVFTAIDLKPQIDPKGVLGIGQTIAKAIVIHHGTLHASLPWHAKEKTAIRLFGHSQVHETFALPL